MESRDQKYIRAKERIAAIKKFYSKLGGTLVAILIVAGVNYYVNEWKNPWFLWVVLFGGISILSEAYKAFGLNWILGKSWEKRKMDEYMNGDDTTTNRWE